MKACVPWSGASGRETNFLMDMNTDKFVISLQNEEKPKCPKVTNDEATVK